jgi:hypothetical protein
LLGSNFSRFKVSQNNQDQNLHSKQQYPHYFGTFVFAFILSDITGNRAVTEEDSEMEGISCVLGVKSQPDRYMLCMSS